jgi:hypothetical protein
MFPDLSTSRQELIELYSILKVRLEAAALAMKAGLTDLAVMENHETIRAQFRALELGFARWMDAWEAQEAR